MYEIMMSHLIAVMQLYNLVDLTAALSTGVHVAIMSSLGQLRVQDTKIP